MSYSNNYPNVCPKCGSNIQSVYHEENNSYYLECTVCPYKDWHLTCTKEIASNFPQRIIAEKLTAYDQRLAESMADAMNDDDDGDTDYYHHWE